MASMRDLCFLPKLSMYRMQQGGYELLNILGKLATIMHIQWPGKLIGKMRYFF